MSARDVTDERRAQEAEDYRDLVNLQGAYGERLARDGAVYLFWDARHSAPERARDLGNELADRLREGGFSVDRVLVEDLRPVPAVCAIGRPQGG